MPIHCHLCGKFVEVNNPDYNPIVKYESFDGLKEEHVCRVCTESGAIKQIYMHDRFVKEMKHTEPEKFAFYKQLFGDKEAE
jgi:hypothetical protein